MNLLELQIEFQRKIVDVNQAFEEEMRPDTYTIESYLNRSVKDYLKKGFLNAPTFEQQLIAIDNSREDLRFLITRGDDLLYPYGMDTENWGTRGKRYRVPDDFMIPVSLSVTLTRTEVGAATNAMMFAQFVNRRQAERIVNDPTDKTIHLIPVAFIEDEFYIVIVGDAYVTAIAAGEFTYLRKPDILSFNYEEFSGASNASIATISTGDEFRALSMVLYVDASGVPTNYIAGTKITKVAGYHQVFSVGTEPVKVGYPWGYTDTPDFPEYMHEDILERATQLFLDEAKLKLVPKE